MVITPVDQRDFDIGSLERACCGDAGKSCADNQDTFLPANRIRDDRLFRRKAFCKDCAHLFARSLPKPAAPAPCSTGYRCEPGHSWIVLRPLERSCRVHVGVGRMRLISLRDRINPKVMAMMTRKTVAPLAATFVNRMAGSTRSDRTQFDNYFAAWNRKMPGIIETAAQ
jgi:hypothetical protein